ncbi:MAG: type II toxin-antitoxin system prevent-host-death family antitoxin [Actinomycetota bacterium]
MNVIGMHEAKTQLSKLVAEVEAGGDVVIARRGRPVARLVRFVGPEGDRGFGAMEHRSGVHSTGSDVEAGDREVAAMFGTD